MPHFGFGKERFHPDLALAHRLLVGRRVVVGAHPLEMRLHEMPVDLAAVVARRAAGFHWAGIADDRVCPVLDLLGVVLLAIRTQRLTLRAPIPVVFGIVGELARAEIRPLLLLVRQGDIGADAHVFHCLDVLQRAVGGVAGHLPWPQLPTEADAPQQVEHRLILHHLAGRHQYRQDDPSLAAIHHIVGLVAQMCAAPFEADGRRIGIGGADAKISDLLVAAMYLALLPTRLGDLIVPRRVRCSKFLLEGRRRRDG
jgi:hypothetical protein